MAKKSLDFSIHDEEQYRQYQISLIFMVLFKATIWLHQSTTKAHGSCSHQKHTDPISPSPPDLNWHRGASMCLVFTYLQEWMTGFEPCCQHMGQKPWSCLFPGLGLVTPCRAIGIRHRSHLLLVGFPQGVALCSLTCWPFSVKAETQMPHKIPNRLYKTI